jgi:hypothetical protein
MGKTAMWRGAATMDGTTTGPLRRLLRWVIGLLPDGGIGNEGPAPDIDGRRDTDAAYRRTILRMKQNPGDGSHATTSYEGVDRGRLNDT